jgi:hypothetical protein
LNGLFEGVHFSFKNSESSCASPINTLSDFLCRCPGAAPDKRQYVNGCIQFGGDLEPLEFDSVFAIDTRQRRLYSRGQGSDSGIVAFCNLGDI